MALAPKTYSMSGGNSVVMTVFGLVLLGCACGVWLANSPSSTGDWIEMVLIEAFLVGLGLLAIGFRLKFTVYPQNGTAARETRFFGVPLVKKYWKFSDFSAVEVQTHIGRKGARAARVVLTLNSGGDPVLVNTFMMAGRDAPTAAIDTAQDLSNTLDVPFTAP